MRFAPYAYIFDIDGTLVDSNELHVDAWDRAFRRCGKHFSRDQLRAQIGKSPGQYLPEFLSPHELERFGAELNQYRSDVFRAEYLSQVRPFPKARELLVHIKEDGNQIGLASSGDRAEAEYYIKNLLEIENVIDGYTCADDAHRSPPAPDIFGRTLEKLDDISPANAVVVGDTRFDVEAAAKAGLATIALLCGGTSKEIFCQVGVIAIYRNPADLLVEYECLPVMVVNNGSNGSTPVFGLS